MTDHASLRLAAVLTLLGIVISSIAVQLHPAGGATLDATFANFAASGDWAVIHLAQFAGMTLILAGLLVLYLALRASQGIARWTGFFGAVAAVVALALAGMLYAVDGVANKQADAAWLRATPADKPSLFAAAQALRWLETGVASYLNMILGIALILLAILVVATARVPRAVGYLMGLAGLAYVALGWVLGSTGFTPATTAPSDIGYAALTVAMVWLLVVAVRTWELVPVPD